MEEMAISSGQQSLHSLHRKMLLRRLVVLLVGGRSRVTLTSNSRSRYLVWRVMSKSAWLHGRQRGRSRMVKGFGLVVWGYGCSSDRHLDTSFSPRSWRFFCSRHRSGGSCQGLGRRLPIGQKHCSLDGPWAENS